MGQHRLSVRRRALAASASTALIVLSAGVAVAALSSPANAIANDKVQICHRDNASNKPYVQNEPALSGDVNGHAGHTGPLYGPDLKSNHIKWGDIIPPFDYTDPSGTHHFDGLNWPAGKATWLNGCDWTPPTLSLAIEKTNDANGDGTYTDSETAATAGSDVSFKVKITNTGDAPIKIDSITDAVAGAPVDLDCSSLEGTVLTVGGTATCTATAAAYSPAAGESKTNQVTVDGHQWGDCDLNAGKDSLRRAAVIADAVDVDVDCSLQEDPGNTVSDTDNSTVDTPAAPEPTPAPTTPAPTPTDSDSPSPEPSDSVSPTPDASDTATATATPTETQGTGGGGGGGTIDTPSPTGSPFTGGGGTLTLPFTGAPIGLLLSLAGLLVAFGAWLTVTARRPQNR